MRVSRPSSPGPSRLLPAAAATLALAATPVAARAGAAVPMMLVAPPTAAATASLVAAGTPAIAPTPVRYVRKVEAWRAVGAVIAHGARAAPRPTDRAHPAA